MLHTLRNLSLTGTAVPELKNIGKTGTQKPVVYV
jgi:hypothetical protein